MPNSLNQFLRLKTSMHSTNVIAETDYYGGVPVWCSHPETDIWCLVKTFGAPTDDDFEVGLYGEVRPVNEGDTSQVWYMANFPVQPRSRQGLERDYEFLGVFKSMNEAKEAVERHNMVSRKGCLQ